VLVLRGYAMSGSYQKTYFKRKVLDMINYGKKKSKDRTRKTSGRKFKKCREYKNISGIVFNQKEFKYHYFMTYLK
jgi:hypothetical protein